MQYIYIVLFLPLAPPLLSSPPAPQNYHLNLKKKIKKKLKSTIQRDQN